MADIFTAEKRSSIMSEVRSKGNKSTELKLIQYFKENDIHGWRRGYKVKGHPDFVFLDKKIAIFVDGCFWLVMIVEILVRQIIENIGKIKGKEMSYMIRQLQQGLSLAGGV